MIEHVDCVVIGAGIVGLATARALAQSARDVLVLEAENAICTGISARSSEVIHAGMYYPPGSLRAKLCVEGNGLLRRFAAEHCLDFKMVGKLIVAAETDEIPALDAIADKAKANGVLSLVPLSGGEAMAMEPALRVVKALWSPDTGIIDTQGLGLALTAELEALGGQVVVGTPVTGGGRVEAGISLSVGGADPVTLIAKSVVLSAGLSSPRLARSLGLECAPTAYLCKGNYFSLVGRMPFSHLIYPVPVRDGLGVHYTLDLAGRGRFGPDVEWVETETYTVSADRAPSFLSAIARYWPEAQGRELEPAYAGIRPKIYGPRDPVADFRIDGADQHGCLGLVALYGIESPGITSSLALARMVTEMLS